MSHLPPVLRSLGPAWWLTQLQKSCLSVYCLHPFQYTFPGVSLSRKQPLRLRSVSVSAPGIRTQGRKEDGDGGRELSSEFRQGGLALYFHTEQALGVGCSRWRGCDLGQGSLQLRQFQRGLSAEGCFLTQFQHHTFHDTIIPLLHMTDSRVIQ